MSWVRATPEAIFNQWLRAASGLTAPLVVSGGPDFMKLLDIDHAGDGEVLIANLDERRAVALTQ